MTPMQIRDACLYVRVVGKGDPLVLMHGGPGLDHSTLLPLEPCAKQYTLVFYDHRCNGRSEGAPVTSMTWENLTADADALRQQLGYDKWTVLGHSFGGMVALEYALRYPEHLSRLILMDTGGDARCWRQNAPDILAKRGYSPEAVRVAQRFFRGQLTSEEVLPSVLQFISAYAYHASIIYNPVFLSLAMRAGFGPPMKMRPEAHVFGFGQLMPGWNVMDRLNEIKVPTLVMAGRHDFIFPPEHQAILAGRLPNAQLELIECAGHNPQMEQPTATIQAIRRFMDAADMTRGEN